MVLHKKFYLKKLLFSFLFIKIAVKLYLKMNNSSDWQQRNNFKQKRQD